MGSQSRWSHQGPQARRRGTQREGRGRTRAGRQQKRLTPRAVNPKLATQYTVIIIFPQSGPFGGVWARRPRGAAGRTAGLKVPNRRRRRRIDNNPALVPGPVVSAGAPRSSLFVRPPRRRLVGNDFQLFERLKLSAGLGHTHRTVAPLSVQWRAQSRIAHHVVGEIWRIAKCCAALFLAHRLGRPLERSEQLGPPMGAFRLRTRPKPNRF